MSPLHSAAVSGEASVVLTLLDAGAENDKGNCDKLPVEFAIESGNKAVVKELLRVSHLMHSSNF